jgi:hypothetical protein
MNPQTVTLDQTLIATIKPSLVKLGLYYWFTENWLQDYGLRSVNTIRNPDGLLAVQRETSTFVQRNYEVLKAAVAEENAKLTAVHPSATERSTLVPETGLKTAELARVPSSPIRDLAAKLPPIPVTQTINKKSSEKKHLYYIHNKLNNKGAIVERTCQSITELLDQFHYSLDSKTYKQCKNPLLRAISEQGVHTFYAEPLAETVGGVKMTKHAWAEKKDCYAPKGYMERIQKFTLIRVPLAPKTELRASGGGAGA